MTRSLLPFRYLFLGVCFFWFILSGLSIWLLCVLGCKFFFFFHMYSFWGLLSFLGLCLYHFHRIWRTVIIFSSMFSFSLSHLLLVCIFDTWYCFTASSVHSFKSILSLCFILSIYFWAFNFTGIFFCVITCVWLFVTPMDHSPPGSTIHGFLRQECWNRLSFPTPGNLSNPGIKPASPAFPALAGGFFTTKPPGKPPFFWEGLISSAVNPIQFNFRYFTYHLQNLTWIFKKVYALCLSSLRSCFPLYILMCLYYLLRSLSANPIICVILDLWNYFSPDSDHMFLTLCLVNLFCTKHNKFYIVECWVLLYFFKHAGLCSAKRLSCLQISLRINIELVLWQAKSNLYPRITWAPLQRHDLCRTLSITVC